MDDTLGRRVTADPAQRADGRWNPAAGLDLVLDELAYGVAVSSGSGELLHANQAARHELGAERALWVHQGRLHAQTQPDLRALMDALARAACGKRSLVTLTARRGAPLVVAVVPVGRGGHGAQPAHVALLFARACVCESLMLCFFARSHSLTSAEENVLGILCQGLSAPQAARHLNVAVSTVRSHVRSLCAKTRTSGVRELVSRVAMLPPVAPALLGGAMH